MGTPVAGPGPLSRRTDMTQKLRDLPNADYGEGAAYRQQQKAAPMAASPDMPPQGDLAQLLGQMKPGPGLAEPSQQPGVPVTDGAALGPGAGTDALGIQSDESKQRNAAYLVALEFMANQPGTSDSARNLVRNLKYAP